MRRLALLALLAAVVGAALARRRRRRSAAPLPPPSAPSGGRGHAPAPAAPGDRFVSVAWALAAPPGDQAELTIRCHQDDALALDRVDVQETPTQVFLTAIARREARSPGEPAREEVRRIVRLSGPLGGRELIATPVDAGPERLDGGPDAPPLYP